MVDLLHNVVSFLNDFQGLLQFLGVALASIWYLRKRVASAVDAGMDALERKIIQTVQESTAQIQIDANGGQSLADVAKGLKSFRKYQEGFNQELRTDLATLKDAVVTLENDALA